MAGVRTVGHSGGFIGIYSNLNMFLNSGWTAIVMSNYSSGAGPVIARMDSLVNQSASKATVGINKK